MSKQKATPSKSTVVETTSSRGPTTAAATTTTVVTKKRSWFSIIAGLYFTLAATLILALLGIVLHYGLMNTFSVTTQYDETLRTNLLKLGTSATADQQFVDIHIPTQPPKVVVQQANKLVTLINQQLLTKISPKETAYSRLPYFEENIKQSYVTLSVSLMHIPFLCIFIIFVYTILSKLPVSVAQTIEGNGMYNNSAPRIQQSKLRGWAARALAGHHNAIEAFSPFAISVVVYMLRFGLFMSINTDNVDYGVLLIKECVCFVALRTLYHVLYILNLSLFRSLVWFMSVAACGNMLLQTFMKQ